MKYKKNTKLITCVICKKKKVMNKKRVTCSHKCSLKYCNSTKRYKRTK